MNAIAIIQARLGSTRLPGKVLMKLDNRTVLVHVIDQVKKSKKLDKIILATSTKMEDDAIETIVNKTGIDVFRGDENNVIKRFLNTSKEFSLKDDDIIIRITADCPLVNPVIIDLMIESHKIKKSDYTFNNVERSMLPRGFDVEIFPLRALKKASELIENDDRKEFYQEHVSKYLADHPKIFKHNIFIPKHILRRPDIKLAIDTQKDLEKVKAVLEKLKDDELSPENIVNLFPKPKIAIYATASHETGTGHLRRMITLAGILKEKIDCSVTFYTNNLPENKELLEGFDFEAIDLTKDNIKKVLKKSNADINIVDIMETSDLKYEKTIVIDTPMNKEDKIIIRNGIKRKPSVAKEVKTILVTMGGSDPDNATETIAKALKDSKKNITVVIGPMFKNKDAIKQLAKGMTVIENAGNMPELMQKADVGIVAAGGTMREMFMSGLPCISIAVSEQQIPNARGAGKKGYAIALERNPTQEYIKQALEKMENYDVRKKIYEKQKEYRPDTEKILKEIIDSLIPE